MRQSEIDEALAALDGRGSTAAWEAVKRLTTLGQRFPVLLLEKYKRSGKRGERAACVYHAIGYAKFHDAAYELGLAALRDRSKIVRYRACMLLAIAQRREAIAELESVLEGSDSAEDIRAAIDALRHGNQHFFVDRTHSGKMTLNVVPSS